MFKTRQVILVAALVLCAGTVEAHHSAAMFDASKTVTISGTVKEFQYTQPHCWLVVDAEGAKVTEWRIETGAPTMIQRMGIHKSTFAAGTKVTVSLHPLKDGGLEGEFISIQTADGKKFGQGAPPPPAA